MSECLHSLRMRASRKGRHLSGAERLIGENELENEALEMLSRALLHPRGRAEKISISVEEVLAGQVLSGRLPDLTGYSVHGWREGRALAGRLLEESGVSSVAVNRAMKTIASGAAPDGFSMRGAMLVSATTGERLEADPCRGVRASRMDVTHPVQIELRKQLGRHSLDYRQVVEALTLAGKVMLCPGVVAELCWSDDPDYLAGYVATPKRGYLRIDRLKPPGEERGGRAFFINPEISSIKEIVTFLERRPVLFNQVGKIRLRGSA